MREILNRDYRMEFLTVGGAAPSPFIVAFADSYDNVSYRLLQLRYGRSFADEVTRRAVADVYDHDVVLEGCYGAGGELVIGDRDSIVVDGTPEVMRPLSGSVRKTTRLFGTMTDIRGSKWRSWGRPVVRATRVEVLGAPCGIR